VRFSATDNACVQPIAASHLLHRFQKGIPYMKKTSINALRAAVAAALAIAAAGAHATDATSSLPVSATVANNCSIATSAVAFGAYDPISANKSSNLTGAGQVSVSCTLNAVTTVQLGQGANADTGSTDAAPARRMTKGPGVFLGYQLYSENTRTTVWGNTAVTGVSHTGTGGAVNIAVYGAVAFGQAVPAGDYNDTVVATVSF
jgi:spore coat protein U-like protein